MIGCVWCVCSCSCCECFVSTCERAQMFGSFVVRPDGRPPGSTTFLLGSGNSGITRIHGLVMTWLPTLCFLSKHGYHGSSDALETPPRPIVAPFSFSPLEQFLLLRISVFTFSNPFLVWLYRYRAVVVSSGWRYIFIDLRHSGVRSSTAIWSDSLRSTWKPG